MLVVNNSMAGGLLSAIIFLSQKRIRMKHLKIVILIIMPIVWAIAFGKLVFDLGHFYRLFEHGMNYLPLTGAISFFAWIGFFCLTAEFCYPSNTLTLPIKREKVSTDHLLQPCEFSIQKAHVYNRYPIYMSIKVLKNVNYN